MIVVKFESLKLLFDDLQPCHSAFQMRNFITASSSGTKYGQYKQALRELHKRWRGLVEAYAVRATIEVDIDEIVASCTSEQNIFNKRRLEIELRKKEISLSDCDINLREVKREFAEFYSQASTLKSMIGPLDESKRDKLEQAHWAHQLKVLAATDYLTIGALSQSTVNALLATPLKWRKELTTEIVVNGEENKDQVIDWLVEQDRTLPEVSNPPELDSLFEHAKLKFSTEGKDAD